MRIAAAAEAQREPRRDGGGGWRPTWIQEREWCGESPTVERLEQGSESRRAGALLGRVRECRLDVPAPGREHLLELERREVVRKVLADRRRRDECRRAKLVPLEDRVDLAPEAAERLVEADHDRALWQRTAGAEEGAQL